jgi:large subunit ribosomal protein L25
MLQVEIFASSRTVTGKGAMRRLRNEKLTPAIVYGAGSDAMALQLDTKTLMATLLEIYRRNAVVTLKVDDKATRNVIVKEVQTDPIADTLIHVDFCEIDLEKSHCFNVPLVYKGTAKGVDLGGALEVFVTNVEVEGKPLDIPNEVSLNIAGLNIGEQLTIAAIELPENVKMVSSADKACVGVVK